MVAGWEGAGSVWAGGGILEAGGVKEENQHGDLFFRF